MLKTIKTRVIDTWGSFNEKDFDKAIAQANDISADIVCITIAAGYLIIVYKAAAEPKIETKNDTEPLVTYPAEEAPEPVAIKKRK